jgi:hypothetical protein
VSKPTATNILSVFKSMIRRGKNIKVITNLARLRKTPHILKSFIPYDYDTRVFRLELKP